MILIDPFNGDSKLLTSGPTSQISLCCHSASTQLSVMVDDRLWYGQPVQIHVLGQFTQLVHVLHLAAKLCTDDRLEEVVDNSDEIGGMNDEERLDILLVPPVSHLLLTPWWK